MSEMTSVVSSPATERTVHFNCQLCTSLCGMVATVDGDRILKVSGDRDHPGSRGYSCAKGRAIPALHHGARRLDRPRLYGEEVPWEVLLDDLAARLTGIAAEGGPDRIARYFGTGVTWDSGMFMARRLMRGLKSRQLYSPLTLDSAPAVRAAELVTGFADTFPSWNPDDHEGPTLAVLIGVNPRVSGGSFGTVGSNWSQRLREYRRRGGEVWVVDPRRTKTALRADRHLALRPGSDVFLLAWLLGELLEDGFDAEELRTACRPSDVERLREAVAPFRVEAVSERTGLAAADLIGLRDAVRRHGKVAIMGGTGASFTTEGVVSWWLMWAAMIVTGSLDRDGGLPLLPAYQGWAAPDAPPREGHAPEGGSFGPGPASRPDLPGVLFGERPAVALVDEIEAGEVQALLVWGGNPPAATPQPERLRTALEQLEVLAVFDAFDSSMARMATHAMPCTWITERNLFFHSPGFLGVRRSYRSPALVPPAGERRHFWWVLAELGRRLGIDVLKGLDRETADDEAIMHNVAHATCDTAEAVIAAGPYGVDVPFRYGWFHEKVLPGGRWRLAPPVLVERLGAVWDEDRSGLRLVNGRILENVNSAAYAGSEDQPPAIHISEDTAREAGIATGDRIRLSTPSGAIEGPAEVDDTLVAQSVWVTHGWLAQNVNSLMDPTPDRLTGQPIFTGVPARVERIGERVEPS